MKTPESLLVHKDKYLRGAWKKYTVAELGQWVHLLLERSTHRKHAEKAAKDVADARNYLAMMTAHIDAIDAMMRGQDV